MTETRTAARMARLITQWQKSGESKARFARRHRMSTWTLWYWSRKLAAANPAKAPVRTPRFVPVQITGDDGVAIIAIILGGGERLRVRPGASADLVRAAVSALRSPC